jgi:N-acetylneuraminate lyase
LKNRDLDRARAMQYAADDIIYTMCSTHANMYAVIKEILRINEGIDIGSVRAPLTPISDQDMDTVKAAADKIRRAREKFL